MNNGLQARLRRLYFGSSPGAHAFRTFLLALEVFLIGFFIVATFLPHDNWLIAIELGIGAILLADFLVRWYMNQPAGTYFRKLSTWADLVVLITLILPAFAQNFLFLRVVRAVRIFRSYRILRELYDQYAFFKKNRDAIEASLNLVVFIFVMSAVVFVLEVNRHPQITNFVDALYFTVSTLSTTGFGDIVLGDVFGRLLSIFIMIVGVGLFLRLLQVIFRPAKVRHICPVCGLTRHEPDAVHCKHCGEVLHIKTEGADG